MNTAQLISEKEQEISEKEQELNTLREQYDNEVATAKDKVMKAKTDGITKSLYLLGFEFASSSSRTSQYLEFHKTFKKEITAVLKPFTQEIRVSTPNHFDVSGFFKTTKGTTYYFYVGDLRWSKGSLLIRTVKDFKDYTGGSNDYITLNEDFVKNLLRKIKED